MRQETADTVQGVFPVNKPDGEPCMDSRARVSAHAAVLIQYLTGEDAGEIMSRWGSENSADGEEEWLVTECADCFRSSLGFEVAQSLAAHFRPETEED